MNERIKELRIEAVNYTNSLKPLGLTLWELTCNQKFAELIVRECIGIIDEEGSHEGGSIRSMEAIKEHFGVEE